MHPPPLLPVLAATEAYTAGRAAGAILQILLFAALIVRSSHRYRLPGANRAGHLSAILALSALLVSALAALAKPVMPAGAGMLAPVLIGLLGLASLVAAPVALVQHRADRHLTGRRSAVAVLLLHAAVVILVIPPLLDLRQRRDAARAAPPAVEIPAANLRLQPAPGWVRSPNPRLYNEEAALVLRHPGRDALLVLISEPVSPLLRMEDTRLAAITRENLLAVHPDAEFRDQPAVPVGPLRFQRFTGTVPAPRGQPQPRCHEYWITLRSARYDQFIIIGSAPAVSALAPDIESMMRSVRELDPAAGLPAAPLESPNREEWGVSLDPAEGQWNFPVGLSGEFPGLVLGGQDLSCGAVLVVLGMPVPDSAVRLREAVHGLLIAQTRFDDPARQLRFTEGGPGELAFRGEADGTLFGGRGVLLPGRALVAMAWLKEEPSAPANLSRILGQVVWNPAVPAVPEPVLGEPMRLPVANSLHHTGNAMFAREEHPGAAAVFRRAHQIWPGDTNNLLNAAHCLRHAGRAAAALDLLDAEAAALDASPDFHAARALALDALEQPAEAAEAYARSFARGSRDEDDLLARINLLFRLGRDDEALRTVGEFLSGGSSDRVLRWQAQAHARAGQGAEARRLMEKILAAPGLDAHTARSHGELCNELGDHAAALATAARLRAGGHADAATLLIEGWAAHGLHRLDEARAKFEEAGRIDPDDEDVREALAHVAAPGSTRVAGADKPLDSLPLPDGLVPEAAAAVPARTDTRHRLRATVISWRPGEPVTRTVHRETEILDAAGVESFKTLRFTFDPAGEQIYLNRLEVLDGAGAVLASARREELYVLDAGEATEERVLHVPVPGLRPGCRLRYAVTRRDLGPSSTFPFQSESFAAGHASERDVVVFRGEVARLAFAHSSGWDGPAEPRRGEGWIAWMRGDSPAHAAESMLPPAPGYAPFLYLGDTTATWARVGSEYLGQIADVLRPDPAAAARAREIGAAGLPRDEVIRRVCAHLRADVRYQAVEFGRRARHPDAPARVLEARHGDCKGQSLLLKQMLEACGVEAHLALVSTHRDTVPGLPDLDQFNHMVVWVPGAEALCIDPTDRHVAAALPPVWTGRSLLVLDPARPRLEPIPAPRLESRLSTRRVVRPRPSGGVAVEEETRLDGYEAAWLRETLAGVPEALRLAEMQSVLNCDLRPRLASVEVEGLDRLDEPLVLRLRYSLPGSAVPARGVWEHCYLDAVAEPGRRHPFEVHRPWRLDASVELHGIAVTSLRRESGPTPFGSWEIKSEASEGREQVSRWTFRIDASAGVHPASRHPDWVEFRHRALDAWHPAAR